MFKFLIDYNIVIPLEPSSLEDCEDNTSLAMEFHKLSVQSGCNIYYHPAIAYDINRDNNINRITLRTALIEKYIELKSPPPISILDTGIVGEPVKESNDWVDNNLLASVYCDAIDYLVTEDLKIHAKARKLGIIQRVLLLSEAVSMLRNLFDICITPPPAVQQILAHGLNESDPIFDSLRRYPDFDKWLIKCKRNHRTVFRVNSPGSDKLAAICIIKRENCLPDGREGKTLKLCTLKVSDAYFGNRYGELLLKAIFDYVKSNSYRYVYFTTYPDEEQLITFASDFGFNIISPTHENIHSGELILSKEMYSPETNIEGLSSLELNIKYGPFITSFNSNSSFIIPIQPQYHSVLFPELESQPSLFPGIYPCGNSIRKAYLSNSSITFIKPGDNVLFYRSQDIQAVTVLGIVEDIMRSDVSDEIARYVGKRTVYSYNQIKEMSRSPVLAILFRLVDFIEPYIKKEELIFNSIIQAAPQSITRINNTEGLRKLLEM